MRWRPCFVVVLLLVFVGGSVATAQSAEDPETLRRELEAERARLEEQMRLLEQQQAAYEAQARRLDELQSRLEAALVAEGPTTETAMTDVATSPQEEAADSEMPLDHLEKDQNQSKDDHEVLTAAELVADDFVGSWPLFGTSYRMKLGGYFKLDALYDFDGAGDKYQFLIGQIPVDGTPEADRSGYFNMFVRETRFNIDIRSSGSDGPAQQFFLEMDFFDESSLAPRLRHAYVVYGDLLVGQTWTTVVELASLPFTIDFAVGDAVFGTRTPQIRWQQDLDSNWSWAVGLEMLQDSGIYNPLDLAGSASPQWPVLAGRLSHERSNGVRTLAALAQQLHWDGEGIGPDASATGWAVIFAGRQNLRRSSFFTWNVVYGDGTAETIMALTGSDANAVLTADGRLDTRNGYSAAFGLGHSWTDTLSSNLAYAWTDLEDIGQRAPDAIRSGGSGHLNLIWSPRDELSTGIELMWGTRENADGADGDATRVQTMIKYLF